MKSWSTNRNESEGPTKGPGLTAQGQGEHDSVILLPDRLRCDALCSSRFCAALAAWSSAACAARSRAVSTISAHCKAVAFAAAVCRAIVFRSLRFAAKSDAPRLSCTALQNCSSAKVFNGVALYHRRMLQL